MNHSTRPTAKLLIITLMFMAPILDGVVQDVLEGGWYRWLHKGPPTIFALWLLQYSVFRMPISHLLLGWVSAIGAFCILAVFIQAGATGMILTHGSKHEFYLILAALTTSAYFMLFDRQLATYRDGLRRASRKPSKHHPLTLPS